MIIRRFQVHGMPWIQNQWMENQAEQKLVANSIDAANDGDSRGIAIYGVLPQ